MKMRRTGIAWAGIDEFGVQKERKRSRWGAFACCDEDGGRSRRVLPRFDRVRCYNGRQQSAHRQPGGGGMGGITTEMRLHEREHRRYILRRMVYELFGVGGEDGGRPISAAAAAKPVSEEDARSGAETTVGGMGSR